MQKLLQRCVGYLSDALGQVIARCLEGDEDEEEEEVVEYNQILDNGSSSKNVPPSSSSRNNASTLNINRTVLSEICSVCESKVEFILPSDADGTAQTSSCRECKTEFDRCSITLLTIGFEPIVEGHVLKCSVCQAVGLLHPSNNRNNAEVRIRDEINVATCKSKGNEFNWSWWDGKAPYCPYCGILMVPLT